LGESASPETSAALEPKVSPPLTVGANDGSGGVPLFAPPRVLEIATLADHEFYAMRGSRTDRYVRAVLNAAEGIYTTQLGIRLDIVKQKSLTSAAQDVQGNFAEDVLESFRKSVLATGMLGNADVYHLFTGKSLIGSTIGLSYVASVCVTGGVYNFGISQAVNPALQPLLAAHEIGHSLGASHDTTAGSIMNPNLSTEDTSFYPSSQNEIHSFVETSGTCLAEGDTNEVGLKVSVGSSFKASLKVSSAFPQTCTALIYGATSPSLLAGRALVGATLVASREVVTEGGYVPFSIDFEAVPPTAPASTQTFFMKGFLSCPAALSSSLSQQIRIKGRSAARVQSRGSRWLNALAKRFKGQ
jgi:hypothetical protein